MFKRLPCSSQIRSLLRLSAVESFLLAVTLLLSCLVYSTRTLSSSGEVIRTRSDTCSEQGIVSPAGTAIGNAPPRYDTHKEMIPPYSYFTVNGIGNLGSVSPLHSVRLRGCPSIICPGPPPFHSSARCTRPGTRLRYIRVMTSW